MKRLLYFCCLILVLPLIGSHLLAQNEEESSEAAPCCFSRAGYQGVCVVQPGDDETCASILEYLNSAGTVGKSYCGGSKLRGGWESVECPAPEEEAQSAR